MTAPRFLAIGTHHKTGTVWMRRTFRKWSDPAGVPVLRMGRRTPLSELPQSGPALCVSWQSLFPRAFFDHPEARFLHVIRDPRDVLISGARYHVSAPLGHEQWLGRKRDDLGGRSYQEAIAALQTPQERLLFEMEGKHRQTLREMLDWPYGHASVVDLRYEDLIEDYDCALFRGALERLGVAGFPPEEIVASYWTHSLFGGIKERESRTSSVKAHIKSGRPAQWRTKLPRSVAEVYAERYGAALITLGYETSTDWVAHCPPDAEVEAALAS